MIAQEETSPPTPVAIQGTRRRWLRVVLGLGVLFLIILLVGWFRAPNWVRGKLEESLEKALAVEATVGDVSLSLFGDVSVSSVHLVDPQGREVATIEDLEVRGDLLALIRGDYGAEADLGQSGFILYQEEDGSWSSANLLREDADDSNDDSDRDSGDDGLAEFDLRLRAPSLRFTTVFLEGEARVIDMNLASRVQGGDALFLERLELSSDFLSGTIEGRIENLREWSSPKQAPLRLHDVQADLRYVPDGLREVLAPFIDLDLTGAAEEDLDLQASGKLWAFEAKSLSNHLQIDLQAGVGRLTLANFTAEGNVEAKLADGWLNLKSDLGLNGGRFDLLGKVDLAGLFSDQGALGTTFSVGLAGVGIGSEFAPLLSALHPLLAANEALYSDGLEGTLDGRVEFTVTAPLIFSKLRERPAAFPLNALGAEGTLGLSAGLSDMAMVKQLSNTFKVDLSGQALVEPFDFAIAGGRITYGKPWVWTVDGLRTTFTGSIGLNQTVDLTWHIPLTERLVKNSSVLAQIGGRELAVPIAGELRSPRIDLETPLKEIANEALQEALRDQLLDRIQELDFLGEGGRTENGLGDLSGIGGALDALQGSSGATGSSGQGAGAKSNNPDELLREANRLWAAGDRAAAQPIYKRIKKEFRLSTAFLLNRSKVKDRADWKP